MPPDPEVFKSPSGVVLVVVRGGIVPDDLRWLEYVHDKLAARLKAAGGGE
jgi:hypothetical protein